MNNVAAKKQRIRRKIIELRNLRPACERDFNVVGILLVQALLNYGVEGALLRLWEGRVARGLCTFGCNAGYLHALSGVIQEIDCCEILDNKRHGFTDVRLVLNLYKVSSSCLCVN